MKKLVCALLLLALLLSGCSRDAFEVDDSEFRSQTMAMLDALITDDYDACRALVSQNVTDAELREGYSQLRRELSGVESYTLRAVYWNKNVRNDVTQSSLQYEMTTNAGMFSVEVISLSTTEGLAGFRIAPVEQITSTGTLGSMEGAGILQWMFLLLGLAEIGFVLWMAVDCLRSKCKGRVGWLLLILLIGGVVNLTFSDGGFSIRSNAGLMLHLTALLRQSNGTAVLSLYVPIGALVYLLQRKKLAQKETKPGAEETVISESEAEGE